MNRLRRIGFFIVLGVLGFVIILLFFTNLNDKSSLQDYVILNEDFIDAEEMDQLQVQGDVKRADKNTIDPVELYHQQVRDHVAGSRFEGIYAQYRETKDIALLKLLIDSGLEGGEYEIIRDELSKVKIDDSEIIQELGAERILTTLFTITPLSIKSYEPLKNAVDRYFESGYITESQKHFWYSLVALAKGHTTDFEYYARLTGERSRIGLIDSVTETQSAYTYAPDRRGIGLYGIAMYEAGRFRVSQNIASILQKKDSEYVLGYQLGAWSNLQLHQRDRAEIAAQKALQYDANPDSKDQYLMIEAIAVYNQGDYARATLLFHQLEGTIYHDYAVRYGFKIAKGTGEGLAGSLKKLGYISMTPSDYYEVIRLVYPPFQTVSQEVMRDIETIIQQCQTSIQSSYSYICIMGKAGVLWKAGEVEKSMIILKQITKQFPTSNARELLAEVYAAVGEEKLSKQAYIQAVRFSQDQKDQERLLPHISNLYSDT